MFDAPRPDEEASRFVHIVRTERAGGRQREIHTHIYRHTSMQVSVLYIRRLGQGCSLAKEGCEASQT